MEALLNPASGGYINENDAETQNNTPDTNTDTDIDTDMDTDTDKDIDKDIDKNTDTDKDIDKDTNIDIDKDTDKDTDTEGEKQAESLADAVDIGWLDLGNAEFYEGKGGFTGLRYKGADHKRIQLRRAIPIQHPSDYISVADQESKEIGMIQALTDLKDDQLRIVTDELNRRYYCPEILEVKSVRDKLGYVYMELEVFAGGERHERNAAINDVNKNIRLLDSNRLIVFDVDGNRFMVNALDKLDRKSLKRLEPYMF